MEQNQSTPAEPWLRGTLNEIPAIPRAVLHALELANEDLNRWCGGLSADELNHRPFEITPVVFHLRHIARSLDRLLTYAEGRMLDPRQVAQLRTEMDPCVNPAEPFVELSLAFQRGSQRIRQLADAEFSAIRYVGSKQLPTTLGGLLVHIADHTQRHVGQAITTAKLLLSQRIS